MLRNLILVMYFITPSIASAESVSTPQCGKQICGIGSDGLYSCKYVPCIVDTSGPTPGSNNIPGSDKKVIDLQDVFSKKSIFESPQFDSNQNKNGLGAE